MAGKMRPRGRIQNEVLAQLRQEPGTLDAVEIAARIYLINPVSKAEHSAVRRALNSLARKGWCVPAAGSTPMVGGGGMQTIRSIMISSRLATEPSPV